MPNKTEGILENRTAFSSIILDTLENMIAPGGRARLSPYVEATQIQVLLDVKVDPKTHTRSCTQAINQHQDRIEHLAKVWGQFCDSGKRFSGESYSDQDFLEAYLIYYFSVNVAKLQITLLDLLRAGELNNKTWQVLDIGVGAGTTLIALADFLLSWQTVCDLYQTPFPIEDIKFNGIDVNRAALAFSEKVTQAYSFTLLKNGESSDSDIRLKVIAALQETNWLEVNLEKGSDLPNSYNPNLIVASNIFNELNQVGQSNLGKLIKRLPEGSTALLIEPGDQRCAKTLMSWRKDMIASGEFSSQGVCNLQNGDSVTCNNCWNSRRQSFHQTILYRTFQKAAKQFVEDKREFEEFENNLLSWSAVWVTRGNPEQQEEQSFLVSPGDIWPDDYPLQYIGRYTNKTSNGNAGPAGYGPDEMREDKNKNGSWREFIKFCPSRVAAKGLTIVREPGFQFPNLRYGQKITVNRGQVDQISPEVFNIQLSPYSQVNPCEDQLKQSDSFLDDYKISSQNAIDEIAYRLFGFDSMRPFQHRILGRVLTGHSILSIAATGSGKSECFILPAILLPGITVVVSPLISLMMDQYDQRICERYGLNHLVTFINGEVDFIERQARLRRMELGYYKLVYFTPEQLERGYVLDSLRRAHETVGVRYLAMDEAHCISQWGHDFRPSYLNLSRRFSSYGINTVRIGLTATASPFVRQDICEELGLNPDLLEDGGDVYVESSNRPELNLVVRVKPNSADKVENILDDLRNFLLENQDDQMPGAAIIFMPHTGGNPENPARTKGGPLRGRLSAGVTPFAAYLERTLQEPVSIYHSKMELNEPNSEPDLEDEWSPGDMRGRSRRGEQQQFIDNQTQIMVATKGFGMGIDKDNIRLIIHRTPPSNLEAYAQEAGRAGRDGYPADVILYYSPDSADDETEFGGSKKVPSDYEIQEFFLNDKYIRRVDLIAMHAFLKSIKPTTGGSLYFTNDQAIEYLDRCQWEPQSIGLQDQFTWPNFSERVPFGKESEDHAEILDRGHLYQEKTNYINRILQTLYRIRPTFKDEPRLAFLEKVHETGSHVIGGHVLNGKAIFESNAYYGAQLRTAKIDVDQFAKIIKNGNLNLLVELLGLSIRETAGMLRDIKYGEGHFVKGVWKPDLLDFKIIAAPKLGRAAGKNNLKKCREYSGAYKRASWSTAYKRAKKNHRPVKEYYNKRFKKTIKEPFPIIDDWFSWSEMNRSTGWEIAPGPAFSNNIDFEDYLNTFMSLHDMRATNDWASYQRMLGDYVGVNEKGSLKSGSKKGDCLRAVLLGYLETYEVVAGDSCYSCSRCVPDGNYGRFSIEERKAVVVRMTPGAIEDFDRLKEMADHLPNNDDVQALFDVIRLDEKAGRSLRGYFSGWSARLLDQNPNHKTALWLRFEGMARGIMDFQAREFLGYAIQIFEVLPEDRFPVFESLIELQNEALSENSAYYELLAKFYRMSGQADKEANAFQTLISIMQEDIPRNQSRIFQAASRLVDLFKTSGPLADESRLIKYTCLAANTAPSWEERLHRYKQFVPSWNWTQVQEEMENQGSYPKTEDLQNALCYAWLEGDFNNRADQVLSWLSDHPERVLSWPEPLRGKILEQYPNQLILSSDELVENYILTTSDHRESCKLGIARLIDGGNLSDKTMGHLLTNLQEILTSINSSLESLIPDQEKRQQVISILVAFIAEAGEKGIDYYWLNQFITKENVEFETIKPMVLKAISLAVHSMHRYKAVSGLQKLLVPKYLDEEVQERILSAWMPLYTNSPKVLGELIKHISLKSDPRSKALSDALYDASLKTNLLHIFPALPTNLPIARWRLARKLVVNLKMFLQSAGDRLKHKVLTSDDLRSLRDSFSWKTDPEEADMLAMILSTIRKQLDPNWEAPSVMFIEVLIVAGRVEYARRLSMGIPDLFFYHDKQRVDLEEYIQLVGIPEREAEISPDYMAIIYKML